jgi:hypothetical protein
MDSFRDFLNNLCLNTGIRFNLLDGDGSKIYLGLGEEVSKTTKYKIEIEDKELYIYLEKENKNNIKLISYIIKDKYRKKQLLNYLMVKK